MYGIDVARLRLDDLDKKCLAQITQLQAGGEVSVLEIGSGAGGFTREVCKLGASVLATDIVDYSKECVYAENDRCRFLKIDCRQLPATLSKTYDIVVAQRVLHYITYDEAVEFLSNLHPFIRHELYVSVSGKQSDIGTYYDDNRPVARRFSQLNETGKKLFSITKPLCLYETPEIKTLITSAGYTITDFRTSAFGNHKCIAIPNRV
jgi:SAM-dependent methyltransferase